MDWTDLQNKLQETIVKNEPITSEGIHRAWKVVLDSGRSIFVKGGKGMPSTMFSSESLGLEELRNIGVFRIPVVYAHSRSYLALEWIEDQVEKKKDNLYAKMGMLLAKQHKHHTENSYGWREDNFIGKIPQQNTWNSSWSVFWKTMRIEPLVQRAKKSLSSRDMDSLEKLYGCMEEILSVSEEKPAPLHGDLWGGNHLVDQDGEIVLIDPAFYYGHREADIAMTKMFSAYPQAFYDAYEYHFPFVAGFWEQRFYLYLLYHQLSHLNHFGTAYLVGVRDCIQKAIQGRKPHEPLSSLNR